MHRAQKAGTALNSKQGHLASPQLEKDCCGSPNNAGSNLRAVQDVLRACCARVDKAQDRLLQAPSLTGLMPERLPRSLVAVKGRTRLFKQAQLSVLDLPPELSLEILSHLPFSVR